MEIVSLSTIAVIISVLASCFRQCHGSSGSNKTETCEPKDCSQAVRFHGDNPFPCLIGRKQECEGFNLKPGRSEPHKDVIPPEIAGVNVYQRYYPSKNKSYPVMNVSLRLPPDEYSLNRTQAVKLWVTGQDQSGYSYCRIFDFRNATFTKTDAANPRYLTYPCFCGLDKQVTGTYLLTVVSLPHNVKVDYYATIPIEVKKGKWISSLVIWQPIGKEEFWVKFDRHPGIHQYKLSLYTYDVNKNLCGERTKSSLVQTKQVDKDGTDNVVFRSLENGMYFVTIQPLCENNCEMLISHCIPLKVYPHRPESEEGNTVTDSKPPVRDTPIITHVGSQHNDKAIKTILGVVCGVIAGVLLVVFLAYLYGRKEQTVICPCIPGTSTALPPLKEQPTVLLLYSPDCLQHTKVVERLDDVLKQNPFNCNVHCDISQIKQIQQKGLTAWLQEKIDVSDFILFVCSLGGRLQCKSNRKMQQIDSHPVEDYFCIAVDEVTSSWRKTKIRPENIAVITMGYSSRSDIPSKLDSFHKFMIRDCEGLTSLYCYLKQTDKKPDLQHSAEVDQFLRALQDATVFFKENPYWSNSLNVDKSRLKNDDVERHSRNTDSNPPMYNRSLSHSQPHSLHSSDGSYRSKVESSKSLTCLNKHSVADGMDMDPGENSHLLPDLRCSGRPCNGSFDSDSEDGGQQIPMPVECHHPQQDVSSDEVKTSESEESIRSALKSILNPKPVIPKKHIPPYPNINSVPMYALSPSPLQRDRFVLNLRETDDNMSEDC